MIIKVEQEVYERIARVLATLVHRAGVAAPRSLCATTSILCDIGYSGFDRKKSHGLIRVNYTLGPGCRMEHMTSVACLEKVRDRAKALAPHFLPVIDALGRQRRASTNSVVRWALLDGLEAMERELGCFGLPIEFEPGGEGIIPKPWTGTTSAW